MRNTQELHKRSVFDITTSHSVRRSTTNEDLIGNNTYIKARLALYRLGLDYSLNSLYYSLNSHDHSLNSHDYSLNSHDHSLSRHDYSQKNKHASSPLL